MPYLTHDQRETKALAGTDALGRTQAEAAFEVVNNAVVSYLGRDADAYSKDGYMDNTVLYSMINQIVKAALVIPFGVYQLKQNDELGSLLPSHPLSYLLYRPSPSHSFADWLEQYIVMLLTQGDVKLLKITPSSGNVNSLNFMPTATKAVGGDWVNPIVSYLVTQANAIPKSFPATEVIHIKKYNPADVRKGLSPVAAGSSTVTSYAYGVDARSRHFANNGPGYILYHDDANAEPLGKEQSKTLVQRIKSYFGSKRREGTVPYVDTKIGALKLGSDAVDLDVLNSVKLDVGLLAMLLNFPPELLSTTDNATYNNTESAQKALYSNCVIPILTQLRDAFNYSLIAEDDRDKIFIGFDTSGVTVLQENKKEVAEYLALVPFMSINQKLKRLGEAQVPAKQDGYIVPVGFTYVKTLDELSEPAADTYAAADDSAVTGD